MQGKWVIMENQVFNQRKKKEFEGKYYQKCKRREKTYSLNAGPGCNQKSCMHVFFFFDK